MASLLPYFSINTLVISTAFRNEVEESVVVILIPHYQDLYAHSGILVTRITIRIKKIVEKSGSSTWKLSLFTTSIHLPHESATRGKFGSAMEILCLLSMQINDKMSFMFTACSCAYLKMVLV